MDSGIIDQFYSLYNSQVTSQRVRELDAHHAPVPTTSRARTCLTSPEKSQGQFPTKSRARTCLTESRKNLGANLFELTGPEMK